LVFAYVNLAGLKNKRKKAVFRTMVLVILIRGYLINNGFSAQNFNISSFH